MSARSDTRGSGAGRIALLVFLAFLAGTVATFFATFFGTLLYWDLAGIRDHDGGGVMTLVFFIAPVVGLFGGICSAFWGAAKLKRQAMTGPRATGLGRGTLIALAAVPAAAMGYLVGFVIVWLVFGPVRTSYFLAVIYGWLPIVMAILSAALAWRLAGRSRPGATSASPQVLKD